MKCPNCGHELTLPHSKPIRDKVVELFDQGLSIDQIAAELYKDYNLRYGYPIRRPEQNVRLHLIKAGRLVRPKPPNFDKRGQAIHDARERGATFTAIAAKWGISAGRVREIYYHEGRERTQYRSLERKFNPDTTTVGQLDDVLPMRALNALKNAGYYDTVLREAAKIPDVELMSIPNFGLASIYTWHSFLKGVGLIT